MITINDMPKNMIYSFSEKIEVKDILRLSDCSKALHEKIFDDSLTQSYLEKKLNLNLKPVNFLYSLSQLNP